MVRIFKKFININNILKENNKIKILFLIIINVKYLLLNLIKNIINIYYYINLILYLILL